MLLSYIGETENDYLDDYFNVWENSKQEMKKDIVLVNKIP
jgi:hypothetical protein